MRSNSFKKVLVAALTLCLLVSLLPLFVSEVEVEANALSVSSLTCSSYISNTTARNYIDKMMKYYITSNSTLQSNLNSGLPVVFMFEGGSDNYWTGSDYANSVWDVRIQAAVFVVKLDSSGNAYVSFCSENCSSIPSYAPNCTAGMGYSGSVTILDGVYRMYRWDHTGPYAAFQLDIPNSNAAGYGLYVPDSVPDGQLLGCSGINVHTRSTTSGSYWSEGCQLIGTGNDSTNEFNAFFKAVTGINANPWISWNPKSLYTWNSLGYYYGSGYTTGYFVVDRQLGMLGMDGTKYGTGSLNTIYNTTALGKLTSYSTKAAEAAGAFSTTDYDYIRDNCTYYPSHCEINVTRDQAPVNSQPCSIGTTDVNTTLEYAAAGSIYTVTGMYKNTYGNFWYQVITKGGKTGYIYAGEAYYVRELVSDITLTDYTIPNGHVTGTGFNVNGTISSKYNQLNTAACWIHAGLGTSGTKCIGSSDTVTDNEYELILSNIDYNTAFNKISEGIYTYAISVNYTNYYSEGASTLKENTNTLYLCDDYFVVISSSVSQSSCSHSYSTASLGSGDCTTGITVVKYCTTCGILTETQTTGAHNYGSWTTVNATCTTDGYKVRTCSICGGQEKETYAAIGHDYSLNVIPATCASKAKYEYTCGNCGDGYSYTADELSGIWLDAIPEGLDASMFNTKTQYRYSDLETTTSYDTSMSGWTQSGSQWVASGTNTVTYVNTWDSGFSTSSSLYTQYNKKSSKVTASETATTKTVIDSDAVCGYLWFHWCPGYNIYSSRTQTSYYTTFHAFYSTSVNPYNTNDYDSGDGSYRIDSSTACSNSSWYWPVAVYAQKSTNYKKQFTYQRWGDYSSWSDTVASASATRQVQTRTLYQLKDTGYGDHSWNAGAITTSPTCTADGVRTYTCINCSTTKTEALSMTGHNYSAVVTAPTCTAEGFTTHTCVNCGDRYIDSQVAAAGHSYGDWMQTIAPTCTNVGTEVRTCFCGDTQSREVAMVSHTYHSVVTDPTCTEQGYTTYTCTACGNSYQDAFVSALGHNWLAATCTQAKLCTVCGEREGDALGHSYNAVVTVPDCLNSGYTTYTCIVCGDTYVDDRIPAAGHSYEQVVTAPTCTAAGYTTYTCSACNHTYQDNFVSALGHSYTDVVTAPGCTSNGFTMHTCTSCGNTYQDTVVPARGHSWNDATCETSKTCSVCGATEGDVLGHSYNAVVTAPTCTEDGYTTYTCATCGDSYVDDAVAAAGHSWNDATCETAKTCSVCGATEGDALGHSWADTTCQAPRTCSICGATEGSALGHNYVNGFCTDCDAYQPAVLNGDFYEISNGGQLYWFADQVNGGNNAINGKLMNDIVVNENVLNESGYLNNGNFRIWVAIGYYESDTDKVEYTGTFDGNGKTVAGLYNEWGTRSYYGLFSIVGSQGAVKNFGVVASYLSGGSYFGCVVGYNYGTVTNCYNAGHIKPYGNYIGGVVGYNAGTVDGCYNLADVSGYGGDYHLGGVVGSNTGLLINCYNTGCVTGDSYRNVGGVVGFSSGTVSGCYNTGSVSANYHTGGIVGLSEHEIIDCYNSGTVSGDTYTGGIAGENYFGIITECYNTGDVFGNDDAGGIVGYNNGYVSKCYNTGNISFRGQYPSSHGGIAGTSNYTGAHISYCYSSGNVSGNSFVGGVVGSAGSTTVTHCYATGNISGSGYSVGGITGSGSPSNCYATGSVSGSDGVGGITGSGSPSNCYYLIGNAVDEDGTVQFGVGIYITGYTRADVAGCTTGMTAEQFASGEACYLLQSDRSTQIWGQLIGTDAYPVFSDDKVYKAGERYTNSLQDACEHQVTYSFSGTTHTVSCSLCGKTVTLSGTDEFKINSAYLTLASDVSVIFRATIPAGFENAYMVFNVNGVEYTAYSMGRDDQGRDLFSYPGINPQMMGDNINAVLYATVDGMEVTPAKTVNYSVLTYCNKQLPTAGKNFKTLISDLLTYGAASQIKLGYKTDALVTDLATTALTPSTFPGASAITNQQAAIGDKNSVADVTGVGLNLSNQVVCKFGFTITDTDLSKYTIKIVIGSKETLINASECYSENGKYWINYCDYSASQFDETITVTLWDGSTQMGRTFTYSVNSYFAKNANSSDAGLAGLVQAVYNYGASAAAYVANPNG